MYTKLAAMLDKVADSLEAKGFTKEAAEIDLISNTLEAGIDKTKADLTPEQIAEIKSLGTAGKRVHALITIRKYLNGTMQLAEQIYNDIMGIVPEPENKEDPSFGPPSVNMEEVQDVLDMLSDEKKAEYRKLVLYNKSIIAIKDLRNHLFENYRMDVPLGVAAKAVKMIPENKS